ncbi:E3 ubiquitin-protein ligase MPSR1-like isoform X1 [Malus sylvestris]|uniref:E3 ubiquitin-protein ligase MPSR1-like isoform X1 n=1 Tax=Malus sylvestris TaxID=3752 RepID=UPI0021ACC40E|nr:E3 ubiquitin-protein ligase MPSR1-like isoform X1 [Malus sylvestris]
MLQDYDRGFLSCIFAFGIAGFLFLLGQAKLTTLSRLVVWIRNLVLCTAALFLIALMHHIVGTILSWLPNRSHSDQEFEGGDDRSHHHRDQDTLPQAPAQDIVTLFHLVLMEVLDRVWEDLVMEEGQEQRPQALQVQALEALPPPLTYCKGGRDITYSCCSDRCTICLEDFGDGEFCRVFACKHMFHSDCIDHWLKNHLTCPICRNYVVDI